MAALPHREVAAARNHSDPDLFVRRRRLMDDWAAYLQKVRGQVAALRR